jgi:hypothetical protein
LRQAGWIINDKRVERIWRREGLKVPHRQPKRGRLWLADGSCIRLRPQHRNHVWSYDFVEDRTHDGRRYRMLNVLDEFTHECLAIRVARKLKAIDVIDILSDLIILRGIPGHIWVRQWTGVRRRGRAKILRALQLITNGSGGNPEVTIDPQTAGTSVWAQNCRDINSSEGEPTRRRGSTTKIFAIPPARARCA